MLVSPNEEDGGGFGDAVSAAGDINGDGCNDIVIGAQYEDPGTSPSGAGRVYIFDGLTGDLLNTLTSPNEEVFGHFGDSVSDMGDVNGDGHDDILIGVGDEDPDSNVTDAGRVYVFDGATGALLRTLVSPNKEVDGRFGDPVSGVGDLNGDGYGDILVGARNENPDSSPTDAGRVYLFNGNTGTVLFTLASPNEEYDGSFGSRLAGAGDVNNDGYGDIVVGAYYEDPESSPYNAGRAYVYDGHTGALLLTLASPNEVISGLFGCAVSGAGDLNGDGYGDILVEARNDNPDSSPVGAGRAYAFDGFTGNLLYTLISPNEEQYGHFGDSVSGGGDVNGDGYDDICIGTASEDPGSSPNGCGRAYLFDGRSGALLMTLVSSNEQENGKFGCAVSEPGDVNGDGIDDIVIGAMYENPGSSPNDAGRSYVFSWMHFKTAVTGNNMELQWST